MAAKDLSLPVTSQASSLPLKSSFDETGISQTIETWPPLAYFALIGGAMSAVFLICLILQLTNTEIITLTLVAGGLVGGLLFTALEVRQISERSSTDAGSKRKVLKSADPQIAMSRPTD